MWAVIHNQTQFSNAHASIVVNDDAGVVVVAFKGTELDSARVKESVIDWIFSNFDATLTPCELSQQCTDTNVHSGYQRNVLSIHRQVIDQIERYINAGYLLMLTGHSKGGAMSTLATVSIHSAFAGRVCDLDRRIYNLNFGSPMTGDSSFVSYYDSLVPDDRTMRFINRYSGAVDYRDDFITTVPGSLLKFAHTKNERIVPCHRRYFGNPDPIPNINFRFSDTFMLPIVIGCHFQQCYMDGLLYEDVVDTRDDEQRRTLGTLLQDNELPSIRIVIQSFLQRLMTINS